MSSRTENGPRPQPNSTNQLFVPMIIGLAFVESLTLYSLVISFILQGKI